MKNSFLFLIISYLLVCPNNNTHLHATPHNAFELYSNEPIIDNKNNELNTTIEFKKFKDLNAALKYSAKQDKMLMIVFSATWCVPCQYMEDYVFNNKQISEFYNNNFVNVYLDADKDKAFISEVNKQVGKINILPSFLFFDKDKYFAFHFEGSQSTSEFLQKGHRALDEQGYEPVLAGKTDDNSSTFWQKIKNVFK